MSLIRKFLAGIGIINGTDVTKQLEIKVDDSSSNATKTVVFAKQTANRNIDLPDASTVLLGDDNTATVTNKTIVVANNTITTAASGNLTSTELNAALDELQDDIDTRTLETDFQNHLTDTTDAHDASAISNLPTGNLAATDVQGALDELQGDIDTINSTYATKDLSNLTAPTSINQSLDFALGTPGQLQTKTHTGNTDSLTLVTGASSGSNSGDIIIQSGDGNVDSGLVGVYSGGATTGNSGAVEIMSGPGSNNSGVVDIQTGEANYSGNVKLTTGEGLVGKSGDIQIYTGTGAVDSGNIMLWTGAATTGTKGSIFLNAENVQVSNTQIKNLADPTAAQDAVNKQYVDGLSAGLDTKESVRAATTADLGATYATTPSNGQFTSAPSSIDGVTLAIGNRVLVKDQTDSKQNGVYEYTAANTLTRAADMDGTPAAEVSTGNYTFVTEGTVNQAKGFVVINDGANTGILTLNTHNINWTAFSGAQNAALRDLSNLTSPTAINQDLLPDGDLTRDLGSASARYAEGYIEKILAPDGQSGITVGNGYAQITDSSGNTLFNIQEGPSLSASNVNLQFINETSIVQIQDYDDQASVPTKGYVDDAVNNYVENSNAINSTVGWATYADAAGTSPVDGTGGTANVTWTRTTSSALRYTSFVLTKDAANRQGQGVSFQINIDAADKGKVLQGSFDYAISSGTYADGDISVWIYDVTNSKLIPCVPSTLKNHSLPAEKFFFEFQTSINSTQYRLIVHVSGTSASAYNLKFSNFRVGPQAKLYGSPITDWKDCTLSFDNLGSISILNAKRRIVGDTAYYRGSVSWSAASGVDGIYLNLPSDWQPDTAKMGLYERIGTCTMFQGGENVGSVYYSTPSGKIGFLNDDGAGEYSVSGNIPTSWGLPGDFHFWFSFPVSGYSSSQIMSHDANTRVVAFVGQTTTASSTITSNTVIPFAGVYTDTHSAWDSINNKYKVKVSGYYKVNSSVMIAVPSFTSISDYDYALLINGLTHSTARTFITFGGYWQLNPINVIIYARAGDELQIVASKSGGISTASSHNDYARGSLSIELLNGPSQIMASENVTCRYKTSAGQSISNGGVVEVLFGTKDWDSHNCYNTSTGRFSPPISGEYEISSKVLFTSGGGWSVGEIAQMILKKNTVDTITMDFYSVDANNTNYRNLNGISRIMLLPTDNISIAVFQNTGGAISLEASAAQNYIEIRRVGNYA